MQPGPLCVFTVRLLERERQRRKFGVGDDPSRNDIVIAAQDAWHTSGCVAANELLKGGQEFIPCSIGMRDERWHLGRLKLKESE